MEKLGRLNKKEKNELLSMIAGDGDSFQVGKIMCYKYLSTYPNEKSFKKKLKRRIKEFSYYDRDANFCDFRGYNLINKVNEC